jgi:hypothetical protein
MSNTTCQTGQNLLLEAKDRLFFSLSMLGTNDQIRVLNAALQLSDKLGKLSPEQRSTTKIHGL